MVAQTTCQPSNEKGSRMTNEDRTTASDDKASPVTSAVNPSSSALMIKRTTLKRATPTSPSVAQPAARPSGPSATTTASIEAVGKCTRSFAPSAARTPRCLSCPEATARFTVATASDDKARRQIRADTRIPYEERGEAWNAPPPFHIQTQKQEKSDETMAVWLTSSQAFARVTP